MYASFSDVEKNKAFPFTPSFNISRRIVTRRQLLRSRSNISLLMCIAMLRASVLCGTVHWWARRNVFNGFRQFKLMYSENSSNCENKKQFSVRTGTPPSTRWVTWLVACVKCEVKRTEFPLCASDVQHSRHFAFLNSRQTNISRNCRRKWVSLNLSAKDVFRWSNWIKWSFTNHHNIIFSPQLWLSRIKLIHRI